MSLTTMSFGDWLLGTLSQFGVPGQLAILFTIFFVDAMLFPLLPEAFVVILYPSIQITTRFNDRTNLLITATTVLLVVLSAEALANFFLYALVKWKGDRLPKRLTRAMNKWRSFLLLSDERAVLLNRIVPVMPFTGAFIAVSPWNVRKAMGYLVLGGALKYGALIAAIAIGSVLIPDPHATWWVSIGLLVIVLAISGVSQWWMRRKMHLPEAPPVGAIALAKPDLVMRDPKKPA